MQQNRRLGQHWDKNVTSVGSILGQHWDKNITSVGSNYKHASKLLLREDLSSCWVASRLVPLGFPPLPARRREGQSLATS